MLSMIDGHAKLIECKTARHKKHDHSWLLLGVVDVYIITMRFSDTKTSLYRMAVVSAVVE